MSHNTLPLPMLLPQNIFALARSEFKRHIVTDSWSLTLFRCLQSEERMRICLCSHFFIWIYFSYFDYRPMLYDGYSFLPSYILESCARVVLWPPGHMKTVRIARLFHLALTDWTSLRTAFHQKRPVDEVAERRSWRVGLVKNGIRWLLCPDCMVVCL